MVTFLSGCMSEIVWKKKNENNWWKHFKNWEIPFFSFPFQFSEFFNTNTFCRKKNLTSNHEILIEEFNLISFHLEGLSLLNKIRTGAIIPNVNITTYGKCVSGLYPNIKKIGVGVVWQLPFPPPNTWSQCLFCVQVHCRTKVGDSSYSFLGDYYLYNFFSFVCNKNMLIEVTFDFFLFGSKRTKCGILYFINDVMKIFLYGWINMLDK